MDARQLWTKPLPRFTANLGMVIRGLLQTLLQTLDVCVSGTLELAGEPRRFASPQDINLFELAADWQQNGKARETLERSAVYPCNFYSCHCPFCPFCPFCPSPAPAIDFDANIATPTVSTGVHGNCSHCAKQLQKYKQ